LETEGRVCFDLEKGPIIRVGILRLEKGFHLMAITLHHIITDGFSNGVLLRNLAAFYSAVSRSLVCELPKSLPFSEYAEQEAQAETTEDDSYWNCVFADSPPVLELPSPRPRPPFRTFSGAREYLMLDSRLADQLRLICASKGCTLLVLLLAGFELLLHKLTNQSDIVVGIPAARQLSLGHENSLGYFVKMLPVRCRIAGNPRLDDFVSYLGGAVLDAYDHQGFSFANLVKQLYPVRDLSRPPLYSVAFNLDRMGAMPEFFGLQAEIVPISNGTARFDMEVNFTEAAGKLQLECSYCADLFDSSTIRRWMGHFEAILEGMTASPDARLSDLSLLSNEDRHHLLIECNDSDADIPEKHSLYNKVEFWARETADAVAVICGDQQVTYRTLGRRSDLLAVQLRSRGVGPEVLVTVLAGRSIILLTAIIAVSRAGGAFLPLDSYYKPSRLAQIMSQCKSPIVVVGEESLAAVIAAVEAMSPEERPLVARIEELISQEPPADSLSDCSAQGYLAYVLFTSGSTGTPKGAMIERGGMLNHLYAKIYDVKMVRDDIMAHTAPLSFDIAVFQFLAPVIIGARVLIVDDAVAVDPLRFSQAIERERLTIIEIGPSLLSAIADHVAHLSGGRLSLASLRCVIATGEALSAGLCRQWINQYSYIPILNAYGLTECSDDVTHYGIEQQPEHGEAHIPIGRPVINIQMYVLDKYLSPVPVGIVGDLYVGGIGVGRGYLDNPERTAEVFMPDPFTESPSRRLYKTGDLGRLREDGAIDFLGRMDHQVKLWGHRVELGEVEVALIQQEFVREAAVAAREDAGGHKVLVAYVVTNHGIALLPGDLRLALAEKLPGYMVPSAFTIVDALPLTPNGKVDRNALPALEQINVGAPRKYVAPSTPTERLLSEVWREVLRVEQVGIDDNFFELRGDSILAIQIVAKAGELGVPVTLIHLFQYPTIRELAAVAAAGSYMPRSEMDEALVPLTPIQGWFFQQDIAELHHFNHSVLLETPSDADPGLLEDVVERLLARHDALRLRFVTDGSKWEQFDDCTAPTPFVRLDLSTISYAAQAARIELIAAELEAGLDLSKGPLLHAAFFDLGRHNPGRLFITVHHLAVDMFSWSILLNEFHSLYQELKKGDPVKPRLGTPFKQWSRRLWEYAQSEQLLKEFDFWLAQPWEQVIPVPRDHRKGANTEASARKLEFSLEAQETATLMREVSKVYRVQLAETVLAALGLALSRWAGKGHILIDVESHGREQLFDDLDASQTVGWFTSLFPVLLKSGDDEDPGDSLREAKERIRGAPNGGIGYGLLRYMREDPEGASRLGRLPNAEVVFNCTTQTAFSPGLFKVAAEQTGPSRSLGWVRSHLLEFFGSVSDGRLSMLLIYSANIHRPSTIQMLADEIITRLKSFVANCKSQEVRLYTPSDFPAVKLNQSELDALVAEIGKFSGNQ